MTRKGYYLHPTVHGETVAFASDDDLWSVPTDGGLARRLTHSRGMATRPAFSPDGERIAFVAVEEGYPEVYVMSARGGEPSQLTRLASQTVVLGWTPDGGRVVFATLRGQPTRRLTFVHTVAAGGGLPEPLPVGPAVGLSFGPKNGVVICRGSGLDPAWWKRYRGGRLGELWIDPDGGGAFHKLIETGGNLSHPIWMQDRIYFHSDHEGIGNLYSCRPDGSDLSRHTDVSPHYLRMPSSGDGRRIAFCSGGDVSLFDPAHGAASKVEIDFPSPKPKTRRRFVPAERFLESFDLHPEGHSLSLVARGKPLAMAHWEGAVRQFGVPGGRVRYRCARWLGDGKRIVVVSDEGGAEALEIYGEDGRLEKRLDDLDIGRPVSLRVTPQKDRIVLHNHRGELLLADLEEGTVRVLDRSRFGRIQGFDVSGDGRFVAYGLPVSQKTGCIMLCSLETFETWRAAEPVYRDWGPRFDPDGKYLYYLSLSGFDPVRDAVDFAYGFPLGTQLKLVTLQADLLSPFVPQPKAPGGPAGPAEDGPDPKGEEAKEEAGAGEKPSGEKPGAGPGPVQIDREGMEKRIATFPVPVGNYFRIRGLAGGKVLYGSRPVEGLKGKSWLSAEPEASAALMLFDFEKGSAEPWVQGITSYELCPKGKVLAYTAGRRLRVVPAGGKPAEAAPGPPGRKNGWVDLGRPKISVRLVDEWEQMLAEGWRLLRDHYFAEDMAGVDWQAVYERYAPLVRRISTRRELSDVFWEMGGELGTSHAYELGGDYPPVPRYPQGFLGADLVCEDGQWKVARIVEGDPGEPGLDSPLRGPGINVRPGDALLAVNGQPTGPGTSPDDLLVNLGGQEVALTFHRDGDSRTVTVKALSDEMPLRYREWVRRNTNRVHRETEGRVGYVHLSDMGAQGFSEFHQAFLSEVEHDALIVDVRYNAGGHVSPLIMQRLTRRRTGYSVNRWVDPTPRPPDSFVGPIVGLTNEFSGSDGDVFSHNFKQLGVGPLIGKQTWGGIVGLNPTHPLVDGTVTTQPEFFNWFLDIGFDLENRGAEPDIPVEITPQDYIAGRDPQMEKAIEVALDLLEKSPPVKPDFGPHPDRTLPA
jgi:tricorn protease